MEFETISTYSWFSSVVIKTKNRNRNSFSGCHLMSHNEKAWKFKHALLQKEEPC